MELIRSERVWEMIGVRTYVETEVITINGDKFVIKIYEDKKGGIECDIEKLAA